MRSCGIMIFECKNTIESIIKIVNIIVASYWYILRARLAYHLHECQRLGIAFTFIEILWPFFFSSLPFIVFKWRCLRIFILVSASVAFLICFSVVSHSMTEVNMLAKSCARAHTFIRQSGMTKLLHWWNDSSHFGKVSISRENKGVGLSQCGVQ